MTETFVFTVESDEAGGRVDTAVAARTPLSRSTAQELIRDERIIVNGHPVKPSAHLTAGDRVEGEITPPRPLSATPEAIPLNVVYQDEDLAVIDKPAGLVVHPAAGHESGTLANALMARFPSTNRVGPEDRPGIVHRLDKDTSGLIVVALNEGARASLQRQIASHEAGRHYLALATGAITPEQGAIDAAVGRDPVHRRRMAVYGLAARNAVTRYSVLERFPGFTYLQAVLETGRTHQIRVHFAAFGHPLAGDSLYGGASLPGLTRQFLHAHELHLRSPSTGRALTLTSELPDELQRVLAGLRSAT